MLSGKIKVNGEIKTATVQSFSAKTIALDVEGKLYYMAKDIFKIWQYHEELNFYSHSNVLENGRTINFLN